MTDAPASRTPEIVTRAEQPYLALRALVAMDGIAAFAARFGELFAWLGSHGVTPSGPPFFRYNVIDMDGQLDMEAGVPVAATTDGDEVVVAGVLPGGRYATAVHVGHPQGLMMATRELLDWAAAQGLEWDMSAGDHGERWGSRLEIYFTDPSEEPDMTKWRTELAFRLASQA